MNLFLFIPLVYDKIFLIISTIGTDVLYFWQLLCLNRSVVAISVVKPESVKNKNRSGDKVCKEE